MPREIQNEAALPHGQSYYVRSKIDPRALIASKSGDVYVRRDGAKWEWPGYKVRQDVSGTVTCTPAPAWYDDKHYPYSVEQARTAA